MSSALREKIKRFLTRLIVIVLSSALGVTALAYAVAPLDIPALFTFLLAWMLHIAVDRAAGYNLRSRDGFIRA